MGDELAVDPVVVRGAAESVRTAGDDLRAGLRNDADAGMGSMPGFSVSGACRSSSEKSAKVFDAITTSWQRWAGQARSAVTAYREIDAANVAALNSVR